MSIWPCYNCKLPWEASHCWLVQRWSASYYILSLSDWQEVIALFCSQNSCISCSTEYCSIPKTLWYPCGSANYWQHTGSVMWGWPSAYHSSQMSAVYWFWSFYGSHLRKISSHVPGHVSERKTQLGFVLTTCCDHTSGDKVGTILRHMLSALFTIILKLYSKKCLA